MISVYEKRETAHTAVSLLIFIDTIFFEKKYIVKVLYIFTNSR